MSNEKVLLPRPVPPLRQQEMKHCLLKLEIAIWYKLPIMEWINFLVYSLYHEPVDRVHAQVYEIFW